MYHGYLYLDKQWGSTDMDNSTYYADTNFPLTFPNEVFKVIPYDISYGYKGGALSTDCVFAWLPDAGSDNGKSTRWARIVSNKIGSSVGTFGFVAIGR